MNREYIKFIANSSIAFFLYQIFTPFVAILLHCTSLFVIGLFGVQLDTEGYPPKRSQLIPGVLLSYWQHATNSCTATSTASQVVVVARLVVFVSFLLLLF